MIIMKDIFRMKLIKMLIKEIEGEKLLKKSLGVFEFIMLGIGVIVGSGIFVFIGVVVVKFLGLVLVILFIVVGFVCVFVVFCYVEFVVMIFVVGSVYIYGYVVFGEVWVWIIGWDLILEYVVVIGVVVIGWFGYIVNFFKNMGINLLVSLVVFLYEGGIVNLLVMFIIGIILILLIIGVKESVKFNNFIVVIKFVIIFLFIFLVVSYVKFVNW